MKNQALFSSKDKSEKLKCCLLQFLFGALRVKHLFKRFWNLQFLTSTSYNDVWRNHVQTANAILTNYVIQSTLVISKSKGPDETLRDIRLSTDQMCSIEENTKQLHSFYK